jgi:hypothetical protein
MWWPIFMVTMNTTPESEQLQKVLTELATAMAV